MKKRGDIFLTRQRSTVRNKFKESKQNMDMTDLTQQRFTNSNNTRPQV